IKAIYYVLLQEIRPNSIPDLKVDATFRKVAKNAITFALWKIDEDRLEAVPRSQFGTFYDNCAYIVYAASLPGHYASHETIVGTPQFNPRYLCTQWKCFSPTSQTREQKPNVTLERYIHYWLGRNVSEQNRSNVVHKIQELDSYLGNVASIYRETQNHESARFLSYFKSGYDILSGALVNSPARPRLFQLHARKWLRAIEMPSIEWTHFNSDYVMVLLTDALTFVWIGRSSSGIERRSALAWVQKHSAAGSPPISIVDDGYEQAMSPQSKDLWNSLLPLKKRLVCQSSQAGGDVTDYNANKFRIYKCNQRGRLHLDQLDVGMPAKDDLSDAHGVYLLDNYGQSIWLWVGAQAPQADALSAMGNGRAFVKKKKYPDNTLVVRVLEGHEPVEFKRLFANWLSVWQENARGHKPVSTKFGKLDAHSLCERPKMAADTQLVDDGRGERIIYRVLGDQVQELPASKAIVFTTNASYVVRYSVQCATVVPADLASVGIKTIIYQWNGSEASSETIAQADKFAIASFEALKEPGMFVQLYEFDEPPHFLQIFKGKLIIMRGQRSDLLYGGDLKSNALQETFLLKVYGDASYNAKAVEETPLSSISSKDCYVIKTSHVWVWCGQSSTGDAREMAKSVGGLLGESSLMLEGKESKEFWQSVAMYFNQSLVINGNGNSCSSSTTSSSSGAGSMCNGSSSNGGNVSPTLSNNCYLNTSVPSKPRPPVQLFLVWWAQKTLRYEEILGFAQQDLSADCTYILDTGTLTYVWLGSQAPQQDRYTAIAQSYVQNAPFGRRPATALAVVKQYQEPNVFKGFFESWQNDYGKNFLSYEKIRQDLGSATPTASALANVDSPLLLNNQQKDFDNHKKYPIQVLVQEMDMLPTEINPLKREIHLTHDDFVSVFKMSFYEFDELPKWKKTELKKQFKLF
ncbi:hypothetical protein KR018_008086, partial [Drosophila ironensis]